MVLAIEGDEPCPQRAAFPFLRVTLGRGIDNKWRKGAA